MSYKLEGKDIVISGFEKGIADSPYQGIGDMRNTNIVSIPEEASVEFKMSSATLPPALNAIAYSADAVTDLLTWAGATPTLYNGCAIVLAGNTATGLSNGIVYYVEVISATTFKLHLPIDLGSAAVNITVNGTGTFTVYQYGNQRGLSPTNAPKAYAVDHRALNGSSNGIYLTDSSNYAWGLFPVAIGSTPTIPANSLVFLGNIGGAGASSAIGTGVAVWKGYLFIFWASGVDIAKINDLFFGSGPAATWSYSWWGISITRVNTRISSLVGQDDAIYIANGSGVSSILEVAGSTFNPTNAATYTRTVVALALPSGDIAVSLAELGTNLLVGGVLTYVYPWDRVSPSFNYPIVVPEAFISNIIGTNQNAYVFAGNRGRIYITNGSNIDLYRKVPDYITGIVTPYIRWNDASYSRNQLYFTLTATNNADTVLTTTNGAWAIDLTSDALRLVNKVTSSGYSGSSTMVVEMPPPSSTTVTDQPNGTGLVLGWTVSTTYGIDVGSTAPYDSFESYLELDMIPTGTYLDPFTPSQVEWKMSYPLGGGGTAETIRLSYRTNLGDSFTTLGTTTATGTSVVGSDTGTSTGVAVSDYYRTSFQKAQWVQLKVEMSSNATTPTYCRLTEIRIRDWPSGKNSK